MKITSNELMFPDETMRRDAARASAVPANVPDAARTDAGQAVYTRPVLAAYDLFVLRFSNRFVWRCPWPHLLAHYDRHVSANHLSAWAPDSSSTAAASPFRNRGSPCST